MTESVTTSEDRKSHRPAKRRALTPLSQHSSQVEALFANPDREIKIPKGPVAKVAAAPPEIVTNVQGSSAGAGSGEFHVYKASRRREYERLRLMDEESAKEKADQEFEERQDELKKRDEEKLSKNRAKREKAKLRKQKKGDGDTAERTGGDEDGNGESVKIKRGLGPAKIALPTRTEPDQDDTAPDLVEKRETSEPAGITIHDDD